MKIVTPKKLIEVALPLKDINEAAAREKSIRHGHPSTLHLWWARRPLAAARAVIFAQMVNAPGWQHEVDGTTPTRQQKSAYTRKKDRLFAILRDLVKWENTNNEEVLERARAEIRESWRETCEYNAGLPGFDPEKLPAFHDPFAGGGAIPLEAQRLGLESYASDLNPVAVMINKAMIEIPPKFAGRVPVGPLPEGERQVDLPKNRKTIEQGEVISDPSRWPGASGLAEDVRRYGYWMREEAKKRIGHLYPKVKISDEMATSRPDLKPYVGQELTVIAWLWTRTVKSPNPQFSHVDVPLVSSFVLSSKKGKEAYVEPVVEGDTYRFQVRIGIPPDGAMCGTKAQGRSANFNCLLSQTLIKGDYIKAEGCAGRMGSRLMAIVCEGNRGRVYLSPIREHELVSIDAHPNWKPTAPVPRHLTGGTCVPYGLDQFGKLFTDRQLMALNTFSDLVQAAKERAIADARAAGWEDDGRGLAAGGTGATAYGEALAVYLGFTLGRTADRGSTICTWDRSPKMEALRNTFGRQAIPMAWDYAEGNPFSESSGNFLNNIEWVQKALALFPSRGNGYVNQSDAQTQEYSKSKVISTDPPYYDNIGYADLSDFFYVWMRRGLQGIYPDLFATMAVPKAEELVATPYRHGGKDQAEQFFLNGMTATMRNLADISNHAFPVTIYYAFKQSDVDAEGASNTGWETFLSAVLDAGFVLTGTWPMRTELSNRMIGSGTNALASSVVLVCRKRSEDSMEISRGQFSRELKSVMEKALQEMTGTEDLDDTITDIAPVDLAQAAIGPGMGVFSKYKAVLKSDGSKMTVHEAMIEINREIERVLDPDNASYDPSTNFFITWFKTYGFGEGKFGEAEVLAKAKGTTVAAIVDSEVAVSQAGEFKMLHWKEYPGDETYDPQQDRNLPLWEALHRVIRELLNAGVSRAAKLLARMPSAISADDLRQLAYYLYTYCERKGDAANAKDYNALVTSWSDIAEKLAEIRQAGPETVQGELF